MAKRAPTYQYFDEWSSDGRCVRKRERTDLHPRNKTQRASLDRVAADPRVEQVLDEGRDGYWADLAPGFNRDGCSSVHEWSCKALIAAMAEVVEGDPY